MTKKFTVFGIILLIAFNGFSQDMSEFSMDQVKQLVESNGKSYLQPLVTGYGSAMNAGLYNTAKTHKILGFDIGLKMGFGIVPTGEKSTYDFDLTALDNIPVTVGDYTLDLNPSELFSNTETPTILGGAAEPFEVDETYITGLVYSQARENIVTTFPGQTDEWYDNQAQTAVDALSSDISDAADEVAISSIPGIKSISGLEDMENLIFPFPILQASVGLPMGIEPSIRMIPAISIPGDVGDALGEISSFGVGLKVDVDQFIPIPLFPVDIAAQAFYQNFSIGDILSANNMNFNVHVSKKLLMLTPYIGMGVDNTTFTASYEMGDGVKQDFTIKGDNKLRTTFGLNIKLLILQVNAEYSMGEYNSAAVGLAFTLR